MPKSTTLFNNQHQLSEHLINFQDPWGLIHDKILLLQIKKLRGLFLKKSPIIAPVILKICEIA